MELNPNLGLPSEAKNSEPWFFTKSWLPIEFYFEVQDHFEPEGCSAIVCSSGASDSMNIIFDRLRKVVVDNEADVSDI